MLPLQENLLLLFPSPSFLFLLDHDFHPCSAGPCIRGKTSPRFGSPWFCSTDLHHCDLPTEAWGGSQLGYVLLPGNNLPVGRDALMNGCLFMNTYWTYPSVLPSHDNYGAISEATVLYILHWFQLRCEEESINPMIPWSITSFKILPR